MKKNSALLLFGSLAVIPAGLWLLLLPRSGQTAPAEVKEPLIRSSPSKAAIPPASFPDALASQVSVPAPPSPASGKSSSRATTARSAIPALPRADVPPAENPSGTDPQDAVAPSSLSLAARARKVEDEANQELERLVPLLGLSDQQQDRIFEKLARNSVYWSPGFSPATPGQAASPGKAAGDADSSPASQTPKSLPDLLLGGGEDGTPPVLTPDQEQALVRDDLERREWWDDALTQLQETMERDAVVSTPENSASSPAAVPTPVPPAPVEGSESVTD
ncbi:MAG: hypothetical protein V4726_04635 [Verrucomicrobiota bacterium]